MSETNLVQPGLITCNLTNFISNIINKEFMTEQTKNYVREKNLTTQKFKILSIPGCNKTFIKNLIKFRKLCFGEMESYIKTF